MSNKPELAEIDMQTTFSLYVISKDAVENVKLYYSVEGSEMNEVQMELKEKISDNNSGKYSVTLPVSYSAKPVIFYFSAKDSKAEKVLPYNAPQKFFYYSQETKTIEIF
jgi:hypothetical protein